MVYEIELGSRRTLISYVKVLPVPVPDTTSTRTCFWTLGATENIRERNYLKYEEVHRSIVPGYKLRTDNLGTILV